MPARSRSRNKWRRLSPEEELRRQQEQQQASGQVEPWREHPTLQAIRPQLAQVLDCWNLLQALDGSSRREVYLPQGMKEPDGVYRTRLEQSRPTGFFRDALRTYAGMLSTIHWRSLPESLQQVIGDVDGMGTDLGVFLFIADLLVLRDGGCLVFVLPPQRRWPSEGHRLEAIVRGDRLSLPRLVLIPRGDLLNWRQVADTRELLGVDVRQDYRRPLRAEQVGAVPVAYLGPNGEINEPRLQDWLYRRLELTDDGLLLQSYRAVPSASEPSGYAARRVGRPLLLSRQHRVPAVWYATDGARFGEGDLPHLGLANQYLTHYRLKSEYEDLLSRCALPVGVRTGLVDQFGQAQDEHGEPRPPEPLVLSTNTFMDLPDGADFNWKEIRARSLAEHRAYLMQLDDAMRRDALVPTENRGSGRTETEVSLTAGQSFALLQTLATRKSSMFGTLLQHWCSLTGDAMDCGAGLSLTVTPLTPPPRPRPTVAEWLQLHERGVISAAELRHQLSLSAMPGVVNPVGDGSADALDLPQDSHSQSRSRGADHDH